VRCDFLQTRQVFWRITLFYIVSLLIVGTLVPYTDPRLLNGKNSADAKASPFVISIQNAGIEVLPSVMNCVIMVSVLSVGNSSIYGSSRTLAALAEQRQAPGFLAYIDRKGRPLYAIIIASVLGFLAYLAATRKQQDAFNWMLALSGLSSIFTWGSICLAHIRFRHAWTLQGHTLDELAFRSPVGIVGSWIGLIFNCLVLIAQFWTAFSPVGYRHMTVSERIVNFFQAYLAAPIVVIMYLGYKVFMRTRVLRARDMDLFTGKREFNVRTLVAEEKADRKRWPRWKKVYKFLC
jgi:yeast amino acid transporter